MIVNVLHLFNHFYQKYRSLIEILDIAIINHIQ